MNRFQAMAKIMAMLTEDGSIKPGSREDRQAGARCRLDSGCRQKTAPPGAYQTLVGFGGLWSKTTSHRFLKNPCPTSYAIAGVPQIRTLPGVGRSPPSGAIHGHIVNVWMHNDIDSGNLLELHLKWWWEL